MLEFWPTLTDGLHIVLVTRATSDQPATVALVGVLWLT
jgi:hypothetical protein